MTLTPSFHAVQKEIPWEMRIQIPLKKGLISGYSKVSESIELNITFLSDEGVHAVSTKVMEVADMVDWYN